MMMQHEHDWAAEDERLLNSCVNTATAPSQQEIDNTSIMSLSQHEHDWAADDERLLQTCVAKKQQQLVASPISQQEFDDTPLSVSQHEEDWTAEDEQLMQACLKNDPWNDLVQAIKEKTAKRKHKWTSGEYGLLFAFCLFMSSAMLRLKGR